jgi:hypothetical protein
VSLCAAPLQRKQEFAMIKIIEATEFVRRASLIFTFINTLFKTINMKKIYVAAITAILLLTFNGVNAVWNGNGYGNGYGNGMNQMSQMNQNQTPSKPKEI